MARLESRRGQRAKAAKIGDRPVGCAFPLQPWTRMAGKQMWIDVGFVGYVGFGFVSFFIFSKVRHTDPH